VIFAVVLAFVANGIRIFAGLEKHLGDDAVVDAVVIIDQEPAGRLLGVRIEGLPQADWRPLTGVLRSRIRRGDTLRRCRASERHQGRDGEHQFCSHHPSPDFHSSSKNGFGRCDRLSGVNFSQREAGH